MNKASIVFIAACLVASHLAAQSADVRGGGRIGSDSDQLTGRTRFTERKFGVRENLGGGICFSPPYYNYCSYDYTAYSNLELYRLWNFYGLLNNMGERDRPQPGYMVRLPEPPPPPAPPLTPVLHEYSWPEQVNTSAPFSIMTTGGEVYLATMVWIEGGNLHFNQADGGVGQLPLSSVSRSLTRTANAQKGLDLPLPPAEVEEVSPQNHKGAIWGAGPDAADSRSKGK